MDRNSNWSAKAVILGFSGTQSAPGCHPTPAGGGASIKAYGRFLWGKPTCISPTAPPLSWPLRRVSPLLPGLQGRRGLLLPLAHSSSPGRKALLLSVSPGTSEMGTDTDNETNQQLQDRLNQDEVATDPLTEKLESGLRGVVPPAPTITIGKLGRE